MMKLFPNLPGTAMDRTAKLLAGLAPGFEARELRFPVFFVGCGRSGTSIFADILSRHPDLAVYPSEANDLWHPNLYPWTEAKIDVPPFWLDPQEYTRVSLGQPSRERYDSRIKAVFGAFEWAKGGRLFVNKSVMVTFMIPHILGLFPNARFIHLLRDGRCSALSYAKKEGEKLRQSAKYAQNGLDFSFDQLLELFGQHWQAHVQEIERQRDLLPPGVFLELRYETLCEQFTGEMDRIFDFLGVAPCSGQQLPTLRNMNYKAQKDMSLARYERLSEMLGATLAEKGYA